MRPEVRAFAEAMEEKLRANDYKGGWKDVRPHSLMGRIIEEVAELLRELRTDDRAAQDFAIAAHHLDCAARVLLEWGPYLKTTGTKGVRGEAADVANMAMMLADVLGALPEAAAPREEPHA
jgi:NTP pyrophosphatase (non-canonical NTP hydrolase)